MKTILQEIFPNGMGNQALLVHILTEVLTGISRIHISSAVVKALKPSKILINRKGQVKVLDCEVSKRIREEMSRKGMIAAYWNAPEVINGLEADSRSDMWSFGIILLELLTGKNPWEGYPYLKTSIMITEKPSPKLPHDSTCQFLRETLSDCLQKDPLKRPTAQSLLKNSFFSQEKPHLSPFLHSIRNLFPVEKKSNTKLPLMPQPKQMIGEDPDEMLISDED